MKKSLNFICLLTLFNVAIGCKTDGKQEKKEEISKPEPALSVSRQFEVDEDSSIINWVGSKPTGEHNGSIKVQSGEMEFKEGKLVSGKFTIAMKSIVVEDLKGQDKIDLENHLKGTVEGKEDHFFNIKKYPKAYFKIKSVEPYKNKFKIKGDLELKGAINSVEFVSEVKFGNDMQAVKILSEQFKIDRTKWGISFMSQSVFDDLKDKFISDEILLQIYIKALKV